MTLRLRPITLRDANAFVAAHHRHHKPVRGHKFSISVVDADGELVGVINVGRPVARHEDNGTTAEVNRSCVLESARNANSMLYAAARRAAAAMGYVRVITYTQEGESGASLRAAGYRVDAVLLARGSWAESSAALRDIRDPNGSGGIARTRWVWP
jgi:hypothetical protein